MRAYADSHTGLVREENQDVFRLLELHDGILVAVLDGMGGVAGGKLAAELAGAEFVTQFSLCCAELAASGSPSDTDIHRLYSHAVYSANTKVLEAAVLNPTFKGMGTTLCAAYLLGEVAYIAHIGDSRAYLLRGGDAKPLTQDDSVVGELGARGELSRKEAKERSDRHFLTRALGVAPYADFHFTTEKLQRGDRLLLVTDGFYDAFSEEEIAALCREVPTKELPKLCIEEACARGGRDNVTVAVVEM